MIKFSFKVPHITKDTFPQNIDLQTKISLKFFCPSTIPRTVFSILQPKSQKLPSNVKRLKRAKVDDL